MGINRVVIFTLFVLCVLLDVHAQSYNVYVRDENGTALRNVIVYTFLKGDIARGAFRQGNNEDASGLFDKNTYKPTDEAKTDDNGFCIVQCSPMGYIILDGADVQAAGQYDFKMFSVNESPKDPNNVFTLYLKLDSVSKNCRDVTHMRDVPIQSVPKMPPGGGGVKRHGQKITVDRELDILGDYSRADARFVAFPYIVYDDVKDSVAYILPPVVVDGKSYKRSMMRRMSFEASRDKLDGFRFDASLQLQDHGSERIYYSQEVNIHKGTKYHAPGLLWYEDYNGVYHRDSIPFSDGKEQEPMRFLDWSDARNLIPIDREKFAIRGAIESVNEKKSYNLRFEQGESRLNLRDSVTVADRDRMLQWLDGCNNNGGDINNIVIKGYSSPEGSEKRNRELSHERAETIQRLLKGRFADVRVYPEYDENDNIVPWQKVADIMTEMSDTLAHVYAAQIRDIIADKKGMDAQYKAIRAKDLLYDYIDKNVLERVRVVDIQADIFVQKVLSNEEIVERYEHDPEFRQKMMPYQYYTILCYLADNEKWDELYEVSKLARERCPERYVRRMVRNSASLDSIGLKIVSSSVPYPLASYYYAVATLKKGIMDVDILKPYLDDGGMEREEGALNSKPFVVAQVLMYCQGEDFDAANALIKKYNLVSDQRLEKLIMFVRCLDGQYREHADVRNSVMSTSPMNKAVIYTALGHYREALSVLYNDSVPQSDAKVEYLKAICHFNLLNASMTRPEVDGYSPEAIYTNPEDVAEGEGGTGMNITAWASPMFNALRLDESNADYLAHDGYFNNAYRQMVLYCWERLKAGVPIERVAEEYRALVARMRKSRAQTN